jgi:adenosine/AMP kinase
MVAKSESFVKAEAALRDALAQTVPDAEVQIGVSESQRGDRLVLAKLSNELAKSGGLRLARKPRLT